MLPAAALDPAGRTTPADVLRYTDLAAQFGLVNYQLPSRPTDSPGFLEGSGGAAVALITSGRGQPVAAEALLTGAVVAKEAS